MTDKAELSGEARARRRSRALLAITIASIAMGGLMGGVLAWYGDLSDPTPNDRLLVALVMGVSLAILSPALTWLWWRRLDEVDRLNQLWAASIGFLVYVTGFTILLVTSELGFTPDESRLPLTEFPLFLVAFSASMITLLVRKARHHFI